MLLGGTGADTLDGGEGSDTAVFAGKSAEYVALYDAASASGSFSIRHIATGVVETFTSVESLSFDDVVLGAKGVFEHMQGHFGPILAGSQARFQMRLAATADDVFVPAIPEIDGAFSVSARARFDDLDGGAFQRVFDLGNGANADNIWLGQVGNGDDMAFEIMVGSSAYRITAVDSIVEGETAAWKASVDDGGYMLLFKDDALVAQGQGAVPRDIARESDLVGGSNWSWDTALVGRVDDLVFA